jgi:hypothetical protein
MTVKVEDAPIVMSDDRLVPTRVTGAFLERWVDMEQDAVARRIENLLHILDTLRAASIKSTYPTDWIIHTSIDSDGVVTRQVGYLQDVGAERAGKCWGIEIGKPEIRREEIPSDGTFVYHVGASAWSKVTGERIEEVQGSRWSGDSFFQSRLKDPDDRVDPTDVSKAAYANLHGRAVRSLTGLNQVPLDMLKAAGINTDQVMMIGYAKGSRGGQSTGAGVGTAEIVIPFGRDKGKKVADVATDQLGYYIGRYEQDLADPGKAQFARNNKRILDALKAEQERRARDAEQPAAADAPAPAGAGRGAKLTALRTRLVTAMTTAGGKASQLGLLIRLLTKDPGPEKASLTDLTDEELDRLAPIDDASLVILAQQAIAPAAEKKP